MFKVDSLFVCCVDNHYTAFDQIEAIKWCCTHTSHVAIVDTSEQPIHPPGDYEGYSFIRATGHYDTGWMALAAIKALLDREALFGQALLLGQYALPIGRGLDSWAANQIKSGAGVLGVEDRYCYYEAFSSCSPLFAEWSLPHELFEDPPSTKTVAEGFQVVSGALLHDMFNRLLLPPPSCAEWRLPFGVFLSWVAQMLNYEQRLIGHMDKPLPPLYVSTLRQRHLPAPHILSSEFKLYYSLNRVPGYSVFDLRQGYKRMREGS